MVRGSNTPRRSDGSCSLSLSFRADLAVVHEEPEDDAFGLCSIDHCSSWQSSHTLLAHADLTGQAGRESASRQAWWSGIGLAQRTNASEQQGQRLHTCGLHCYGVRFRLPTEDGCVRPRFFLGGLILTSNTQPALHYAGRKKPALWCRHAISLSMGSTWKGSKECSILCTCQSISRPTRARISLS